MKFTKALPFHEGMDANDVKRFLPTTMSSREAEELARSLDGQGASFLARARFSAKVRSAQHLDALDSGVRDLTAGVTDLATARLRLKQFVRSTGYVAPEEKRGGLEDLASTARTNVQLQTNVQLAQGYGWHRQGQDADLLFAFPAREFVRVEARNVPRNDWPQRWDEARSATVLDGATASGSGRMVALVGHPIWKRLSRFGLEYEPFDYGSGMGTEDVSRRDAIGLGLLQADTVIFPSADNFNADLSVNPQVRSERLRAKLESTGLGRFDGDTFVFQGGTP